MKLRVVAAVGVVALMLGAPAAYAATVPLDETISVPGEIVPAAFVCVDDTCVEVEGVQDLVLHIQATAVIADNTQVTTTGANCARVDQKIALDLDSGATGKVTVSFFTVDPQTGQKAPDATVEEIPFAQGVTGTPSPVIQACVR